MLHYTIGDKSFTLPAAWQEVTVGQFLSIKNMGNSNDIIELLVIMTGLEYDYWFQANLNDIEQVLDALGWAKEMPPIAEWQMPKQYTIGGREIDIPNDLALETLGQRIVFEQSIFPSIEKSGDVVDVMDKAIAIYIQPSYTGKPFTEKLDDVVADVRASLFIEAYPIATFFLKQYLLLLKRKTSNLKVVQHSKK